MDMLRCSYSVDDASGSLFACDAAGFMCHPDCSSRLDVFFFYVGCFFFSYVCRSFCGRVGARWVLSFPVGSRFRLPSLSVRLTLRLVCSVFVFFAVCSFSVWSRFLQFVSVVRLLCLPFRSLQRFGRSVRCRGAWVLLTVMRRLRFLMVCADRSVSFSRRLIWASGLFQIAVVVFLMTMRFCECLLLLIPAPGMGSDRD